MSGLRHHFIPQFLQRGFASRATSKHAYVFVHGRDRPPYEASIVNVGIERQFYTLDGKFDVDNAITRAESSFATLVAGLRSGPFGEVAANRPAELIAHLEVRTRHTRMNMVSMGHSLIKRLHAFAGDREAVRRLVIRNLIENGDELVESIHQQMRAEGIGVLASKQWIRSHLPSFVAEKLPEAVERVTALIREGLAHPGPMLEAAARAGQLRALKQGLSPLPKTAEYRRLAFSVERVARELVLGDSAVVFEVAALRSFTPFLTGDEELLAAYLPLSKDRVLVGRKQGFEPDLDRLPEAIAKVSAEYLIAASNSDDVRGLRPLIGQLADLVDDETMDAIFTEVFVKAALPR